MRSIGGTLQRMLVANKAQQQIARYSTFAEKHIGRVNSQRLQQTLATNEDNSSVQVAEREDVVFIPLQEVEDDLAKVMEVPHDDSQTSLGRTNYHPECEAGVNEQINIEYNMSYMYHDLANYFKRDSVHLPGIAQFFKDSSAEERQHAELLMEYQNKRGGHVELKTILQPSQRNFNHPEKGDALYAFELALALEKLNLQKLHGLHQIADKHEDYQMADYVESFLGHQVDEVRENAGYVAMLRRVGKGHGVFHFDKQMQEVTGVGAGTPPMASIQPGH